MKILRFTYALVLFLVIFSCVKKVEDSTNTVIEEVAEEKVSSLPDNDNTNNDVEYSDKEEDFESEINKYNNRAKQIEGDLFAAIQFKNDFAEITIAKVQDNQTWSKLFNWKESYNLYGTYEDFIKELIKKIGNKGKIDYQNYVFFKNSKLLNCQPCDDVKRILTSKDIYKDKFNVKNYSQSDLNLFLYNSLIPNEFMTNSIGVIIDEKESKILYIKDGVLKVLSTLGADNISNKKVAKENINSKLNGLNINYVNCFITGLRGYLKDESKKKLYRINEGSISISENERFILSAIEQSKIKPIIYYNDNASYAIGVILKNINK